MIFLWKSCTKRDSKPHDRQRHRQSATLNMVYGELGATPLSLISQNRMVMFWARIKQVKENLKISSLLFQILLKMYKNGHNVS